MPTQCFGLVTNAAIKNDREYLAEMILNENREDIISDEEDYSEGDDIIIGPNDLIQDASSHSMLEEDLGSDEEIEEEDHDEEKEKEENGD